MKKLLAIIALAAALVALPLSAADSNQRSVTTVGTVNVTIPADSAELNIRLSVTDTTLEISNSHLDEVLAALRTELKSRGIPEKSVVLESRDVTKSWESSYNSRPRTFLGYTSTARVIISIDDISKLNPLITYFGLHEEYGPVYTELRSSKIGEERKAVLASALRLARNKAEVLANEGGAKLGALLNASEEDVRSSYGGSMSNSAVVVPNNGADGNRVISINVSIRATFALE